LYILQAGKKGVSPIVVGFIIGTFQGTIGLSSLVFGSLVSIAKVANFSDIYREQYFIYFEVINEMTEVKK